MDTFAMDLLMLSLDLLMLSYYINLFSPNKYEKNDKIMLQYFQLLKRL